MSGFIPDSQFVADEDKYGGLSGELKSAGLGAARSASFGLSDEAIVRLGLMTPESLKAYKETNPTATTLGEIGGAAGAMLAPEVGVLGALSAPVRAVSKVGGAVTKAALPVAEGVVGRFASAEARPLVNKVLSQAGAMSAGSAIEGAVYGLGQSVSEHALGDPDLTGEKVLANIGTGAITGGVLGGLFGGVKGGLQAKKMISEVDKAGIEAGNWESIANASDLPEPEKESFIKGLRDLKGNADEIKSAAESIGAPILPGNISANKNVQRGQDLLLNGPPTYSGLKTQQLAQQGFEKSQQALESTLGDAVDLTKASVGDTLKGLVSKTVEDQNAPISALYDELKNSYQVLPVSEKSIADVAKGIRTIEDVPFSPQAKAIAEGAAERVEALKTVDDIKRLKTIINQELGIGATPIQKRITSVISDKLASLEEGSIVDFAEKEVGNVADKEKILSLLEKRKEANSQYKVFRSKIDKLGELIGRKKIHGPQDFLDALEDITPEKIADKLGNKNNSKFLDWFSKEMPEGMAAFAQYQKGLVRDAAMKDGEFSVRKAITAIEKMPKEYKAKIFSPEELKKIADVKTYIQSFPSNFNPSNTSNASAFRHFFENGITGIPGAGVENMRDLAISNFINSSISKDIGGVTKFVEGLATLERNAVKTSKAIASGSAEIFSDNKELTPVRAYLAISHKDNHDDLKGKLHSLNADPEKLIDHIDKNTRSLSEIAPRTSQSIQSTMIRATTFLKDKLPQGGTQKPLSPPYAPSDAELAKWHRYFNAVEKPTNALREVASGTLNPETMETLAAVYPKLLADMQRSVTEKMINAVQKGKSIAYRTKLSLSMFLGADLVSSLEPTNMLSNQNVVSTATQMKQSQEQMTMNPSVNKQSSDKIHQSNRLLTPGQASSQRAQGGH
jgi:hypothetical protein